MESPLLLDRPSTQLWAGVPCRVDVPAMNSSFRTSHEVSSHETLVMQWAPSCSQNMCKIPNRLSACADLVSTCTPTFTPSSLHSPLPDPYQDSICMPSSLGESLPHHWFRVLDFAKKKKKKIQTSCPPHCGETHEILSCFSFFLKKKRRPKST